MRNRGFTIVELLIVIVIIAIHAAITIVAYNGMQNRARASEAASGIRQSKQKLEVYKVDNGNYPTTGNLSTAGVSDSSVTYQYTSGGLDYCITGTAGTVSYKATNTSAPSSGGCPGHGQGGSAPVTNLALNPSVETNLTSIQGASGTTYVRESNGNAVAGSQVLRVTTNGAAAYEGVLVNVPVDSFGNYIISAHTWGSGQLHIWSRLYFTDLTYVESPRTSTGALTSSPQRFNASQNFTDNGKTPTSIQIHVRTNTTQAVTFYVDGFMVTKGPSQPGYADGSSTDWAWNGTAHNSTSTGPSL